MSGRLRVLRFLVQVCALACIASAIPLQNITLPLPVGTSNHNIPGLLCTPTKWIDIILFYLFNYVAHAATVLTRPGERSDDYMASTIGSLLFPALGLYRGIDAILSRAGFVSKDGLRKAARSGALCVVVRAKDWRPFEGEKVSNAVFKRAKTGACVAHKDNLDEETLARCKTACPSPVHVLTYSPPWLSSQFQTPSYVHRQIIHGTYKLPEGYRFAIVPSDARFTAPANPNTIQEVSATYNFVKALIALVQSVYALLTVYRSRGDQIAQFGFAAFGLTVTPYAVMSTMNLIGNLCRPDYASLYMVKSSIMDEACKRGGLFRGTVGRVCEEHATAFNFEIADCHIAENLRFTTDEKDDITATFGVEAPPRTDAQLRGDLLEKPASACTSLVPHSHGIHPLPEKSDYAGTENDAILLVPCCNPIQRGSVPSSSVDEHLPPLYRLTTISLHKSVTSTSFRKSLWFHKQYDWFPAFTCSTLFFSLRVKIIKYLITVIVALTPLAVYGGMSHFQPGSIPLRESSTWKNYTIQWLILGVFSGMSYVVDQEMKDAKLGRVWQPGPATRACLYIVSASSAVGGFVVVGQMLSRYGVCVWVGD